MASLWFVAFTLLAHAHLLAIGSSSRLHVRALKPAGSSRISSHYSDVCEDSQADDHVKCCLHRIAPVGCQQDVDTLDRVCGGTQYKRTRRTLPLTTPMPLSASRRAGAFPATATAPSISTLTTPATCAHPILSRVNTLPSSPRLCGVQI